MPYENSPTASQAEVAATYFNGFELGLSNSDVSIAMLVNGRPQIVANMSFTTVKTLHQNLGQLIETLEKTTERSIMTMEEVAVGLAKISEQQVSGGEKGDG